MIFNIPVGRVQATISVYGAADETVTLTHNNGKTFTFTANDGLTKKIPLGTYTVSGNKSNYSKTATVTAATTRINAWPDGATIYYWYGYSPIGSWATIDTLPSGSPYLDYAVTPTMSKGTNSVQFSTSWDYARGGTVYLPKTTIEGSTMYLVCSASHNNWMALNLCPGFNYGYTPGASKYISNGATLVAMSVTAVDGKSYYPAISMNTSGYDTGSVPAKITVKALYSV